MQGHYAVEKFHEACENLVSIRPIEERLARASFALTALSVSKENVPDGLRVTFEGILDRLKTQENLSGDDRGKLSRDIFDCFVKLIRDHE